MPASAVAVVTGGGTGIGRAVALELSQPGSKYSAVIIVGRRAAALEETAQLVPAGGVGVEPCIADIGNDDGVAAVVKQVGSRRVAALVHNAATIEPITPVMELNRTDWRTMMAVNVETPVFLTKALLQQLDGARVLLIGSGAGETYIPGLDIYSISKASLKFIFPGLRDQLKPRNIHVGYVNPGFVDTAMPAAMIGSTVPFVEYLKQRVASGDIHQPAEIGRFIAYVLSEQLSHEDFTRDEGWDVDVSEHPIEVHETSERRAGKTQALKAA